jgi:hypothetical protein
MTIDNKIPWQDGATNKNLIQGQWYLLRSKMTCNVSCKLFTKPIDEEFYYLEQYYWRQITLPEYVPPIEPLPIIELDINGRYPVSSEIRPNLYVVTNTLYEYNINANTINLYGITEQEAIERWNICMKALKASRPSPDFE